jgi:hypothetical protein
LGALWHLFYGGKVTSWDVHKKLFHSLVSSTVLYSSHIWGSDYVDILEKVQSHFIRRLFHLDIRTPTYALRLETNTYKLELSIARLTLNFMIRILGMEDQRIARKCYFSLINYTSDNRRYNWSLNLKALLETTGFEHLWTSPSQIDFIINKQTMLDRLQSKLRVADFDRATKSNSLQYLAAPRGTADYFLPPPWNQKSTDPRTASTKSNPILLELRNSRALS